MAIREVIIPVSEYKKAVESSEAIMPLLEAGADPAMLPTYEPKGIYELPTFITETGEPRTASRQEVDQTYRWYTVLLSRAGDTGIHRKYYDTKQEAAGAGIKKGEKFFVSSRAMALSLRKKGQKWGAMSHPIAGVSMVLPAGEKVETRQTYTKIDPTGAPKPITPTPKMEVMLSGTPEIAIPSGLPVVQVGTLRAPAQEPLMGWTLALSGFWMLMIAICFLVVMAYLGRYWIENGGSGLFSNKSNDMETEATPDGGWQTTVGSLLNGTWTYKFDKDGKLEWRKMNAPGVLHVGLVGGLAYLGYKGYVYAKTGKPAKPMIRPAVKKVGEKAGVVAKKAAKKGVEVTKVGVAKVKERVT